MSGHSELYDKVKNMVAKLYVLRDSCTGIINSDKAGGNLSWFEGAEAILKEAVDEMQEALLDELKCGKRGKRPGQSRALNQEIRQFYRGRIPVFLIIIPTSSPLAETRGQRSDVRSQGKADL